jgi:multiple sugar transport system ATP-binding protein
MRAEIKKLHLAQHATTVYVTHDQVEALAMGDRIVVMSAAVVQQVGTPHEVYAEPANLFVARFIGSPGMSLVEGTVEGQELLLPGANRLPLPDAWRAALERAGLPERRVIVGFRPEAAQVGAGPLRARIYADDLHGPYSMLHLELEPGAPIVHARAGRQVAYAIDAPVSFGLDPQLLRFFHPSTERAIDPLR